MQTTPDMRTSPEQSASSVTAHGAPENQSQRSAPLATGLLSATAIVSLMALAATAWRWMDARNAPPVAPMTSVAPMASAATASTVASSVAGTAIAPTKTPRPAATPRPTPDPQSIPRWAQGAVINRVPVRPGDKVFALTFDDGPWPEYTDEVLKVLDAHDVKATFFMVGQEAQRRPAVVRAVRDAGHAIGGHSWSHAARPRDPVGEVRRTDAVLKSALGFTPVIFRPPYGLLKNGMARQAMQEKQAVLIWSADSNDWKKSPAGRIASRILSQASSGGVGLLHDGGGSRANTVAALPAIINGLRARGYRFVTIPELLRLRYVAPPKKASKPWKPQKPRGPQKSPRPLNSAQSKSTPPDQTITAPVRAGG